MIADQFQEFIDSFGFSTQIIISPANKDRFISFFPVCVTFISSSCLITQAKTSSTMLKRIPQFVFPLSDFWTFQCFLIFACYGQSCFRYLYTELVWTCFHFPWTIAEVWDAILQEEDVQLYEILPRCLPSQVSDQQDTGGLNSFQSDQISLIVSDFNQNIQTVLFCMIMDVVRFKSIPFLMLFTCPICPFFFLFFFFCLLLD